MAQNDGKQNKKPHLLFVNIPTMDTAETKQTENILLSSYSRRHPYDSKGKMSV